MSRHAPVHFRICLVLGRQPCLLGHQAAASRLSLQRGGRVPCCGQRRCRGLLAQLFQEFHSPLQCTTLVYCDNFSTVYLSTNPVQHQRTKHVEIDLHFIRERVAADDVRVLSVPTTLQFVDIFTKGLSSSVLRSFDPVLTFVQDRVETTWVFEYC
jgi:hypothetical protein